MKIKQTLLDSHNATNSNGISIGGGILLQSKKHLWDERQSELIDVIVIHYISAINTLPKTPYHLSGVLQIFVDYEVSSHYLISRRGGVYLLVPEEKKAWHCGPSKMPSPDCREGVNEFSIGIELIATHTSGFTDSQYRALTALCCDIELRHQRQFSYVGHDQIAVVKAVELMLTEAT